MMVMVIESFKSESFLFFFVNFTRDEEIGKNGMKKKLFLTKKSPSVEEHEKGMSVSKNKNMYVHVRATGSKLNDPSRKGRK